MSLFRKRPVVVNAVQWDGFNFDDVANGLGLSWMKLKSIYQNNTGGLYIRTSEGQMHASIGDWIICGVQGELYPCKPDIFEQTYEPEATPE